MTDRGEKNEFTRHKITHALALLVTLFALHPFLHEFEGVGFDLFGWYPKVGHLVGILVALLALSVYCFSVSIVREKRFVWAELAGNTLYAFVMPIPAVYGGLYLSSWLGDQMEHAHAAWAVRMAPWVTLGFTVLVGLAWLVVGWLRLSNLNVQDAVARMRQLDDEEHKALSRAADLFPSQHYDMAVVESWKALESRLHRALLAHGKRRLPTLPDQLLALARRAGLLTAVHQDQLELVQRNWHVALSPQSLGREDADATLKAVRDILATIPVQQAEQVRQRAE